MLQCIARGYMFATILNSSTVVNGTFAVEYLSC